MAQVHDLGPLGLQEPTHDVDGGVVPVEQAGGGHEAHRVDRPVELGHRWSGRHREGEDMAADYYDVVLKITMTSNKSLAELIPVR